MKHLVVVGLFLVAPAAAQDAPASPAAAPMGKIVFYRQGSLMGAAVGCPIRYHDRRVVELARGKYAEWTVQPDEYVLTNGTSSVDLQVRPGETRYVRCQIKSGFASGRADLQVVDQETFAKHAADFERKEPEFQIVPAIPAQQ